MRCMKHIIDVSSTMGVCASCLRECLFEIAVAQAEEEDHRETNSNSYPSPLMFPRSVSPYISRRKSDTTCNAVDNGLSHQELGIEFQHFFSTPHVGPGGKIIHQKKKTGIGSSLIGKFFSSKSDKFDSDIPGSGSGTRSWFGTMFSGRRRNKTRTDSSTKGKSRISLKADKGISPTSHSDGEDDCQWRETPKRTPAWIRSGKAGHMDASRLRCSLSPWIKASPSGNWNPERVSIRGYGSRRC